MIRRLNECIRGSQRRVIYEGNGFCKVMQGSKLIERIQLERGDNLMEALGGLQEEIVYSHGSGYDSMFSVPAGGYEVSVSRDAIWDDDRSAEVDYLLVRIYDNSRRKFVASGLIRYTSPEAKRYAMGLATEISQAKNLNKMLDILESDSRVERVER